MYRLSYIILAIISLSCSGGYKKKNTESKVLAVKGDTPLADSSMFKSIQSYKKALSEKMGVVIAQSAIMMAGDRPESLLTNFVSDFVLSETSVYLKDKGMSPDISLMNKGGLRVPIQKGDVTVGNVYELMPFENRVVVLTLKGDIVKKLCDRVAARGGEGVAGITLEIKDGKSQNIKIGGKSLDLNKTYRLVTSDYIAKGGDTMSMLKDNQGYLDVGVTLRDLILNYFKKQAASGKKLTSKLDGRIKVVK